MFSSSFTVETWGAVDERIKNEAFKGALEALQRPLNIWGKNLDADLNEVNSENYRGDAEKNFGMLPSN